MWKTFLSKQHCFQQTDVTNQVEDVGMQLPIVIAPRLKKLDKDWSINTNPMIIRLTKWKPVDLGLGSFG